MGKNYTNIRQYVHVYVENTFNLQPNYYFRYIYDICLIWPHGIDTLETCLENSSRTHLAYVTAVSFLNVIIKINNPPVYAKKTLTAIAFSITPVVILCT